MEFFNLFLHILFYLLWQVVVIDCAILSGRVIEIILEAFGIGDLCEFLDLLLVLRAVLKGHV